VVLLCLLAVLFAALAPASSVHWTAFLLPVCFLFACLVVLEPVFPKAERSLPDRLVLRAIPARAPPLL
jgi:hypothetical protein